MTHRTRIALLAACLSALPSLALADSGVPAWNGVYLGINAGYAFGNSNPFATYVADPSGSIVPAPLPSLPMSSVIGGLQAGYNARLGHWLIGGEVDFNWMHAKADALVDQFWSTNTQPNYAIVSSQYDWLSTARLRVGVLATPSLLVYATGGLAVTRATDHVLFRFLSNPPGSTWDESRTLFGVAFGGGIEYALTPQWSVKAEYLHAQFNDVLPQWFKPGVVAGSPIAYHHSLDIVRGGVNYRWDAPSALASTATASRATWTGFYAGLNAGYAAGRSDPFATGDTQCAQPDCMADLPKLRPSGFIGGAQIGYNRQAGMFVLGGELDFSGIAARSEAAITPFWRGYDDTGTFSSRYDWLFTARLRAGVAVAPDWLLYATGGLAVTHVRDSTVDSNIPDFGFIPYYPVITAAQSKTLFGVAFGGGIEYAVSRNWSIKAEYLHAQFNKTAPPLDTLDGRPAIGFEHRLDIVRAGFNYRFD